MFVLPGAWLRARRFGSRRSAVGGERVGPRPSGWSRSARWSRSTRSSRRAESPRSPRAGLYHGFLNGAGLGASLSSLGALTGLAAAVFALAALVSASVVALPSRLGRIAVRVAGRTGSTRS